MDIYPIANVAATILQQLGLRPDVDGNDRNLMFFDSLNTEFRYRVRATDDNVLEVEECDEFGYGLGQNFMQFRNPAHGLLHAVLGSI